MTIGTKISWCDDTVNPWWGCAKISRECTNCYAESMSKRTRKVTWGSHANRWVRVEAAVSALHVIARKGDTEGRARRVFIGSMCDILEDREELAEPRRRIFSTIDELGGRVIALLLTKRIGYANRMMPRAWRDNPPPWVWWGTTAGTQARWDSEVPDLLETSAALRFVSVEPMLEPIDTFIDTPEGRFSPLSGIIDCGMGSIKPPHGVPLVDWLIIGGESGPGRRTLDVDAAESLAQRAGESGCDVFVKQDSALLSGQRGRLRAFAWAMKQIPEVPR